MTGQYIAGMPLDSNWPYWFFTFPAEAGTHYQIQLSGSDSALVSLRLLATNLPVIIDPPRSETVSVDDSALFTVVEPGCTL